MTAPLCANMDCDKKAVNNDLCREHKSYTFRRCPSCYDRVCVHPSQSSFRCGRCRISFQIR
jgi:hypothetical protein